MRIGGRLSEADILSSTKYQLILSTKHHVVQLLILQISHFIVIRLSHFFLPMAECQLSILGEDAWYVHEEKQDKMNL